MIIEKMSDATIGSVRAAHGVSGRLLRLTYGLLITARLVFYVGIVQQFFNHLILKNFRFYGSKLFLV